MSDERFSFLRTIEQQRAEEAYADARGDAEYRTAVNNFVPMVVNAGLLQTLTYYSAKPRLRPVYQHIESRLKKCFPLGDEPESFIKNLCELESPGYRAATMEAIAYATWLKRFAEARKTESTTVNNREKLSGAEPPESEAEDG